MTFKILTKDLKIISRSLVRPATQTGVFENSKAIKEAPEIAPTAPNATVNVKGEQVEVVIPETVTDKDDEAQVDDSSQSDEDENDTTRRPFIRLSS